VLIVMAPSEWPHSHLLANWLLVFSGKQPLHGLSELATHLQEYFGSNLNVATLHRGKVVLADPNTLGKLLLCHIDSVGQYRRVDHLRMVDWIGDTIL
jgi:hypothetical protein